MANKSALPVVNSPVDVSFVDQAFLVPVALALGGQKVRADRPVAAGQGEVKDGQGVPLEEAGADLGVGGDGDVQHHAVVEGDPVGSQVLRGAVLAHVFCGRRGRRRKELSDAVEAQKVRVRGRDERRAGARGTFTLVVARQQANGETGRQDHHQKERDVQESHRAAATFAAPVGSVGSRVHAGFLRGGQGVIHILLIGVTD
eukprot:scaffold46253_cov54-Attheya_sp.AAC.1